MADPIPPTAAPAPAKSRMNRWLAAGLIVSVALNLAFVGWSATRFIKYRHWAERDRGQIEEQVARRLPEQAAKAFRRGFEQARKDGAVSFHHMNRDLGAALAAEPYDRARIEAVLADHRRRLDQLQEGMQSGLLAAADAMTPEQRREYAEKLLRRGPPPPPGGPGGPPHMRGMPPPPPPAD